PLRPSASQADGGGPAHTDPRPPGSPIVRRRARRKSESLASSTKRRDARSLPDCLSKVKVNPAARSSALTPRREVGEFRSTIREPPSLRIGIRVKKVLIANRGEIAVRIIRTLRALGLSSVVVHHAADAESLAVREADDAVEINAPTPVAGYLDTD